MKFTVIQSIGKNKPSWNLSRDDFPAFHIREIKAKLPQHGHPESRDLLRVLQELGVGHLTTGPT